MSTETNANPKFTEQPAQLYDPGTGKVVAQKAYNVAHDTTYDIWYGDPATGSGGGGGSGAVTDLTASGTISAAQPSINTPVTSASVSLALGTGQSTFRAMLSNGGGGFTSGTTIVVDKSPDGGTTWFSSSFKVSGASPNSPVSSIVGPGPLQLVGNAAGATHVKVRCSVLNGTETIAVKIDASVGVSEVGIIAPLPAGSNNIGGVEIIDSAGTNKLAIDASGRITIIPNTSINIAQIGGVNTQMATANGVSGASVQEVAIGGYNGATIDRLLSDLQSLRVNLFVKSSGGNPGDTAITLGSATSLNSIPIVIASDQSPVPNKRSAIAAYTLASTTTTGSTQNSADITVGPYTEISIDINTTAQSGTSPTVQYFYERKGADNIYYVLWQSAVLTTAANTLSTSIGAGMAYNQSLGLTGRLRWVVGGSATPTFTHSLNIYGK